MNLLHEAKKKWSLLTGFYDWAERIDDIWHVNFSCPIRELIGQLNHRQSKLLVWRKSHRMTNLVYKMFHVPHGEHRYCCRQCTMRSNVSKKATYFEAYDMYGCLYCNQWLEKPGIFGVPETSPKDISLWPRIMPQKYWNTYAKRAQIFWFLLLLRIRATNY